MRARTATILPPLSGDLRDWTRRTPSGCGPYPFGGRGRMVRDAFQSVTQPSGPVA